MRRVCFAAMISISIRAEADVIELERFFDEMQARSPELVVAVVTEDGIAYERAANGTTMDTPKPLASVTKTFTTTALAALVAEGKVRLDDPISLYLPPEVAVPQDSHGRVPTLGSLATHTAGLADMPDNWQDGYTCGQLYEAVSRTRLLSDVGTYFHYSNFGVGLLGEALARAAGIPYAELIETRVAHPLNLRATNVVLEAPRVEGHVNDGCMGGAGNVYASGRDLAAYVRWHMRAERDAALAAMPHRPRYVEPDQQDGLALGWFVSPHGMGSEMVWHNGAWGGSARSFVGFSPQHGVGVVLLAKGDGDSISDGAELLRLAALTFGLATPRSVQLLTPNLTELAPTPVDPFFGRLVGEMLERARQAPPAESDVAEWFGPDFIANVTSAVLAEQVSALGEATRDCGEPEVNVKILLNAHLTQARLSWSCPRGDQPSMCLATRGVRNDRIVGAIFHSTQILDCNADW